MKRSTLVVLVIFLALAGLVFYLRQQDPVTEEPEITPVSPAEFLLTDTDGIPTSIDIQSNDGQQVTIARNADGVWVLEKPIETGANQGSAEAAATQLSSLRIVSHPEVDPGIVGLNPASYTLTVKLTSGDEKTVRIGDLAPTGSGYYANVNGSNDVLILSQTGLDALLIMLESPPVENTPMP
jgi:hypothetical protein